MIGLCDFCLSFRLKYSMRTTIFAVILLLLETVCAVFDNMCASAYSTMVGDCFLDHTSYLTITYFSSTFPEVERLWIRHYRLRRPHRFLSESGWGGRDSRFNAGHLEELASRH